ncbi:claudin-12 isoform X2 [Mirounga angustirostris]|uniref:claudin-12 isoform X2 n=1 Tax=Mirounga angustirostris TaxID=9716 RepID=UPI0023E35FA0|nr:claudin-12 isoform X2 [Mirounga angustirostris]
MGCRDVHAATVLSFLCGIASVAGLFAGTLLPNWRKLRLITFNRNEKNLTVYTGLWVKCARYDGSSDCLMYDTTWYSSVDQLDLRVLQFALPLSILIAMGALLLCLIGMCNTAFRSSVPNIKLAKCLVNSAGCHLVAGLLFFLAVGSSPAEQRKAERHSERGNTSRGSGRERSRLPAERSPMWGWIAGTWDHELSRRQTLNN